MRSALIWCNPQLAGGQVLIEAEVLALIDKYQQNTPNKPESGGIFLGYRRGAHLHVTMATEPQAADRGWRCLFKRSARHHQDIALRLWNASDKKMDYLGEWHTHPEPHPSPSGTDRNEWRKICNQRSVPMVFMIMGWSGNLWLGISSGGEVERCTAVDA